MTLNSVQVSVAVVTYNQREYLRECIESILAQDYINYQIIVADDHSTDGTQELLKEFADRYPGKFLLRLSKVNQGITGNSNLALSACDGKYVAWIGGDDLMFPHKLSMQVEYMENHPECVICYHDLELFESHSRSVIGLFSDKSKPRRGGAREAIRYGAFNGASSTMVRRCKAPSHGFDKLLPMASDWLYWVETLVNGGTIEFIPEVLGRYRRHDRNVTRSSNHIEQNELDHLNSCNIILLRYPEYLNEVLIRYAANLVALRHKLNYFRTLWVAICIRPNVKATVALLISLITLGWIRV